MKSQNSMSTEQLMDKELLDRFFMSINVRPRSADAYRYNIKIFFDYLTRQGIAHPGRQHILDYRDALIESGKKTSTLRAYLIVLRLFFRWAESEGLYCNIADYIKIKGQSHEHCRDALTGQQVRVLLRKVDRSTIKGLRNYAILMVMVIGGLRCVEVSRAKIGDFTKHGRHTVLYVYGKGRDDSGTDYIKLPCMVQRSIRDYLKERGNVEQDAPLFVRTGNYHIDSALSTRSISRIVKNSLIDAGYDSDRLCAHSLRHTAVTLALKGGEKLEAVKEFARHSSIDTTLTYSHAIDHENSTCSQTIERAIFGRKRRRTARPTPAKA